MTPKLDTSKLELAQAYARAGFRVVAPLCWPTEAGTCGCGGGHVENAVGKAPLEAGWPARATTDPGIIAAKLKRNPHCNVGLMPPRDVIVLDVDRRSGGPESLAYLLTDNGDLPDCPTQETGGGGRHYIMRLPAGTTTDPDAFNKLIGAGLEVKLHNGQFVAAPSIHPKGKPYRWAVPLEAGIPEVPPWLLSMILKSRTTTTTPAPEIIGEMRHVNLRRIGGAMRRQGVSADNLEVFLLQVNETQATEPLPEREVRDLARWLAQKPPGDPELMRGDPPRMNGAAPAAPREPMQDAEPIRSISARDFVAREWPQRPVIVDPWLRERSVSVLYAPTGVGKSNLTLALLLSISGGVNLLPSFGWKIPKRRRCLYVDGEMVSDDVKARLTAMWPWELPEELRILSDDASGTGLPPLSSDEGRELIDREIADHDPAVVVFDNVSTLGFVSGMDSNAAESWDVTQEWLRSLRRRGLAVIVIDHSGKAAGRGPRGSSRKLDIADATIELTPPAERPAAGDGARFKLSIEKTRGFRKVAALVCRLETIEDDDGVTRLGFKARPADEEAEDRAREMLDAGMSRAEIAVELGVTRQTVYRWLPAPKGGGKG